MSIFKDKTLLITGGTGSFGNAVLRRFLNTDIKEIRIFSRDEKKQDDMRHEYQVRYPEVAHKIKFYIGDVRNLQSCKNVMPGVDYIFHAAALKQVPSCEFFPMEAVKTNVIGTDNILTAAIEAGVGAVICLSTDKAAYPINAMGITKAIEEKVAVAKSRYSGKTKICCTRYGNVMCSRGSVIPLWIEQIRSGNPITLTEPSMTRFIMSLDEAVDLVLFAFEHGQNGDILVQKAPACTIGIQAEAVCELFGGKKEDIKARRCMRLYLPTKNVLKLRTSATSTAYLPTTAVSIMTNSSRREMKTVKHLPNLTQIIPDNLLLKRLKKKSHLLNTFKKNSAAKETSFSKYLLTGVQ